MELRFLDACVEYDYHSIPVTEWCTVFSERHYSRDMLWCLLVLSMTLTVTVRGVRGCGKQTLGNAFIFLHDLILFWSIEE